MTTLHLLRLAGCLFCSSLALSSVRAGSATWALDPLNGDWNTAANWTPATIPDGSDDVATFTTSNLTSVSLSQAEVESVVFTPGADAFTIRCTTGSKYQGLTISGAGIINNSGTTQNFEVTGDPAGSLHFLGEATAGKDTVFTSEGGYVGGNTGVTFFDTSSAGDATFINEPGNQTAIYSGGVTFDDQATAARGNFICNGGTGYSAGGFVLFRDNSTADDGTFLLHGSGPNGPSGNVEFLSSSSAGDAVITAEGSDAERGTGGDIRFYFTSSAANATLIANGGQVAGGQIIFSAGSADGGKAHVKLFGNGFLYLVQHDAPGVIIGSLEGDGPVFLGENALGIGSNDLSTVFSGVIQDDGSLTKVGRGTLTLTNDNRYSGGTVVRSGTLRVTNTSGSGTGAGAVNVNGGTLGGSGIIAGAVTVGRGSGRTAVLAPGAGTKQPATLTLKSGVSFKSDAVYTHTLKARRGESESDQVIAEGVTIENGAQFDFRGKVRRTLVPGTSFTAISNTAATPISGTFANLPEGAIIDLGGNNLQASYEGGDGNDLTLTVVP